MSTPEFKVIIVGGSLAGLTLAHCLLRAGISHIVLERRSVIAPEEGASIGILPNGARVLDQLGIYEHIQDTTEPLSTAHIRYPDGFYFSSRYPEIIKERFGYPIAFLPRRRLLEILYTSYPDHSNIYTNKNVIKVQSHDNQVSVLTEDGNTYRGDLVVGADGVNSRVLSEIWKLAGNPSLTKREGRGRTIEYACVFGISSPISDLKPGEQVNAFYDGLTIVTIHGRNGEIFWFFIKKLSRRYIYPDLIRLQQKDAEGICEEAKSLTVWKGVTFGDIWERRETASLTVLDEFLHHTWSWDRSVCVGDSIHKMTPNFGQGANTAIEDSAALANLLHSLIKEKRAEKPTDSDISLLLRQFKSQRLRRVQKIYKMSRFVTRLQARDGLLNTLLGRHYAPYAADLPAKIASGCIAGAEVLDYLPLPKVTGAGWNRGHRRSTMYILLGFTGVFTSALAMVVLLHIRDIAS
uniref:FAD-dependent monooxygenase nodM n=1 Tax=Hypoxylon pulicicidum TaxID=1243767 RepID=NODM_HYPPI|nr:RecName: Full=FAD-dependent monooxygenase nodM; AltName: Full=Nodulisporic acid biosynthesis cluster protein M [Hypoxylon pulicicidum]AUM60051.1 FAD-dependent oxygenase [Hypoxylon pulicicidum]